MWLKIKVWTKIIIFGILTLYVLIFVVKNGDRAAKFWYWFGRDYEVPLLFLVFFAFIVGVVGTILVRTSLKTVAQFREMRQRSHTDRLEQEVADMRVKAAMLQTRPASSAAASEEVVDPDRIP
jgi:uncharacterized integral membrane protein